MIIEIYGIFGDIIKKIKKCIDLNNFDNIIQLLNLLSETTDLLISVYKNDQVLSEINKITGSPLVKNVLIIQNATNDLDYANLYIFNKFMNFGYFKIDAIKWFLDFTGNDCYEEILNDFPDATHINKLCRNNYAQYAAKYLCGNTDRVADLLMPNCEIRIKYKLLHSLYYNREKTISIIQKYFMTKNEKPLEDLL